MVAELLDEAAMPLAAVDCIATSIGPGAFTGVRITVATAQGLGFGAALPIVPISTLEALAWDALYGEGQGDLGPAADAVPVLTCLDARMGEVYWAIFVRDEVRGVAVREPPRVSPPGEVRLSGGRHRGIGRGFASYPALTQIAGLEIDAPACRALPDARAIARLARCRWRLGEAVDAGDIMPLYVRDKVALTELERTTSSQCHIEKL
jgi:tRNA threonylcarbamoyladenosine biosynthesis protein TsaB